jgi:hypothetical protein
MVLNNELPYLAGEEMTSQSFSWTAMKLLPGENYIRSDHLE